MKLNKLLLSLAVVPFTLLAFSVNSQSANAQITGTYTKHESSKQMYEDTGMTAAQRREDFNAGKNIPTHMDQKDHDNKADKKTSDNTKSTIKKVSKHKESNKKTVQKKVIKKHKSSFYTIKDLKKGHHATIKVLKPMMAHKNISFKSNHSDKKVRKNQHLKVIKVRKFKNVFRFQLNNHKFITSSKHFVKLLK